MRLSGFWVVYCKESCRLAKKSAAGLKILRRKSASMLSGSSVISSIWMDALSPLQNVFKGIQGDLLGLAGQQDIGAASSIAGDPQLSETHHAFAKVGEYRNQHGKMVVHLALGNGYVQLYFSRVRGRAGSRSGIPAPHSRKPIHPRTSQPAHSSHN